MTLLSCFFPRNAISPMTSTPSGTVKLSALLMQ